MISDQTDPVTRNDDPSQKQGASGATARRVMRFAAKGENADSSRRLHRVAESASALSRVQRVAGRTLLFLIKPVPNPPASSARVPAGRADPDLGIFHPKAARASPCPLADRLQCKAFVIL